MTELTTVPGDSPFDAIKRTREDGTDYWSARDLMPLLGYGAEWRNFTAAIDRAKLTAQNQDLDPGTLFGGVTEKSGGRPREDFHLARYAAYLVAMNGDPRKPEVAAAQSYFAIRTREAEVAQRPKSIEEMTLEVVGHLTATVEEQKRQLESALPKADYVDQYVNPDGDFRILRAAANELGTREGELRELLLARRWIYAKPMDRRRDKRTGEWKTVYEYWPSSEKSTYFRMLPQHNAPTYRSGQVRRTLNVTPPGMTALARLLSKEIAA